MFHSQPKKTLQCNKTKTKNSDTKRRMNLVNRAHHFLQGKKQWDIIQANKKLVWKYLKRNIEAWRHTVTSRRHLMKAQELKETVAALARKLCIDNCEHVEPLTLSQIIPLPNPPDGLWPFGIGEVFRRLVGKCVMKVAETDIMKVAGDLQVLRWSTRRSRGCCSYYNWYCYGRKTVKLCWWSVPQTPSTHSTEKPCYTTEPSHV